MFLAPNGTQVPRGFAIDPNQAIALAKTAPKMIAIHRSPSPAADRRLRMGGEPLRDLLLLPQEGHRGSDHRPPRSDRGDVHRAADPRHLRPRPLRPDLRLSAGARAVHADVPAPAAAAPRPVVVRPVRHRGAAHVRRLLPAVRQQPPRAGRVDVLSAADLPARPDADPRLQAAPGPRTARLPPAHGRVRTRPGRAGGRADRHHAPPGRRRRRRNRIGARRLQASARAEPLLLLARSRRHLRADRLSGLHPVRAAVPRQLGLPAGGPRGDDHVRPADDRRPDRARVAPALRDATGGASACCSRGSGPRARAACSAWRRAPTTGSWR